ncbi:MAG: T9SS type A sorting domain-containing protein [Bacteroidetes bacterium]|nr:MAG: T9SS type A sorting domain-containing protein [Bacteroidota bacterium]
MKKLLLSAIISSASFCVFAQTPTWDFESWTGTEPAGWISENELMIIGNPQSVFEETAPANVHGGAKAMRLLSVTMTSPVVGLPNPIGLAAPGKLVSFAPKFGMQYTSRPALVNFWYKYTPAAGDTAEFLIFLWNSTTGDTLGSAYWNTGTAVSAYTAQGVPIIYDPAFSAELPDSMALTFSSSRLFNANYTFCTNCGKAGSTLWVDDISFSGWNGINENLSAEGVTLFPNPAKEFVNIAVDALDEAYSVTAYDVTGRSVSTTPLSLTTHGMNRKSGMINTSTLPSGLYSYSVVDKSGAPLRTGKFNVVR